MYFKIPFPVVNHILFHVVCSFCIIIFSRVLSQSLHCVYFGVICYYLLCVDNWTLFIHDVLVNEVMKVRLILLFYCLSDSFDRIYTNPRFTFVDINFDTTTYSLFLDFFGRVFLK